MRTTAVVTVTAGALLIGGCQRTPEEAAYDNYQAAIKEITLNTLVEKERVVTMSSATQVDVPSDPNAQYWIVSKAKMENGHLEVISRRLGPSGESYARREVDCATRTVRYIGEGDTLEEAKADSPNPSEMREPIWESITGVITSTACR